MQWFVLFVSDVHLKISALASRDEHRHGHWHWNWHCKNFVVALINSFMKNRTFMRNAPKYSFLYFTMRHRYLSATLFSMIFHNISTKLPKKRPSTSKRHFYVYLEAFLGVLDIIYSSYSVEKKLTLVSAKRTPQETLSHEHVSLKAVACKPAH